MSLHRPIRLALFWLALAPISVLAHDAGGEHASHTLGFVGGLLHPLSGVDHWTAMLMVGFWSALAAQRRWIAPLAFAAVMLVGAVLGRAGVGLPAVEPMIAASLLVFGLLVAYRLVLPSLVAAGLVGLFALFHGVAHGQELAPTGAAWQTLLGMLLTTVALHLFGLALGVRLSHRSRLWPALIGSGVAGLGTYWLLQSV